jgi:hypothetical protein
VVHVCGIGHPGKVEHQVDVVVFVVVSRGQGVALMTGITSLCFPVEAGTSLYCTFESIDKARTLTCTIKVL